MTIYGKYTEQSTANSISIQMQYRNINDNGYTTQIVIQLPLSQDDNTYSGTYQFRPIDGMVLNGLDATNKTKGQIIEALTQTYNTVTLPVNFTITDILGYPSTVSGFRFSTDAEPSAWGPIVITYERRSVEIGIDADFVDDISSGRWEEPKTALFEQEIPLPVMKKKDGKSVESWSASLALDPDRIINRGGVFYYKVGATDPTPIVFTPNYPASGYKVTFITPIGEFDNGYQRFVASADSDSKVSRPSIAVGDESYNEDNQTIGVYKLVGFYNGEMLFDFNGTIASDLTLVAKWEVSTHEFSYSSDDHTTVTASAVNNVPVYHGTEVLMTITPGAGYDLDVDETIAASSLGAMNIGSPEKLSDNKGYSWRFTVTNDVALSIKSKVQSADISFVVNGKVLDEIHQPQSTRSGDIEYNGKNIPLYTTVTFGNYNSGTTPWYTTPEMEEGDELENDNGVYTLTVTENITLYSYSNVFNVYYHGYFESDYQRFEHVADGGGNIQLKPIEYDYDGYVFVGWGLRSGDGPDYTYTYTYAPKATVHVGTNTSTRMDLYAFYLKDGSTTVVWDGNSHYSRVEVDNGLGHVLGDFTLSVEYSYDKETYSEFANSVNFTDVGEYSGTGVYSNTAYYRGSISLGAEPVYSFNGSFEVVIIGNHDIKFYNGNTLVDERRISNVQTLGPLPSVTRGSPEAFEGWFVGNTRLSADTLGSELPLNARAEAKWKHTVTFDTVGGSTVPTQYISDNGLVIKPADPTKPAPENMSYTFQYWIVAPHGSVQTHEYDFSAPVTEDLTLIAVWQAANAHEVELYSAVGGVLRLVAPQYIFDGEYVSKPTIPNPYGLTLAGWFLFERDDTEESGYRLIREFDFNAPFYASDYTEQEREYVPIKLVPKWNPSMYTVLFDPNGGTGQMPSITIPVVAKNVPIDSSPISLEGYRMAGWALSAEGDIVCTDKIEQALTGTDGSIIKLYAKWVKQYDVTFDSSGGTDVASIKVDAGSPATEPQNPTKNGYKFAFWYKSGQDGTVPYDFRTPVNEDLTLLARWTSQDNGSGHSGSGSSVDKETETIENDDGSVTHVDKETKWNKDGSMTEKVVETTTNKDGSKVVREEYTSIDRDGKRSNSSTVTETETSEGGITVERSTIEATLGDGSKVEGSSLTMKDAEGNVIDKDVRIVTTEPSGSESILSITGDSDSVEVKIPDTKAETLREVGEYISDISDAEVIVVYDSPDGTMSMPSGYLIEASRNGYDVTMSSGDHSVTIDSNVIRGLTVGGMDAALSIQRIDPSDLTQAQRDVVGDNYVLSLSLAVGDRIVSDLGGNADISVVCDRPYDRVYFVKDNGDVEEVECNYNEGSMTMEFTLTHFSVYVLSDGPIQSPIHYDSTVLIAVMAVIIIAAVGLIAVVRKV